jgi:hypothetical protein
MEDERVRSIVNCGIAVETRMEARKTQLKQNSVLCQQCPELISIVLHQADSEFWCDKEDEGVFRTSSHYLLLPREETALPRAYLRIRELIGNNDGVGNPLHPLLSLCI